MEEYFIQPVPPVGSVCPFGSASVPVGYGGEDFATLMIRYNVSFGAMQAANPGMTASPLDPGQRVCIPQLGTQRPVCPAGTYTLSASETLGSLPPRLNADIYSILRANPGLTPSEFTGGRTICRP